MKCEACNWQEMPNNVATFVKHVGNCSSCSADEMVTVWRDSELVAIKRPTKKLPESDTLMEDIVFKKYERIVKKVKVQDSEVVIPEETSEDPTPED